MIINYNKFKNFYDLERRFKIIESIILHELVHWYDLYYTYNNLIVEKYGNVFEKRSFGTFEGAVGGIYQNRSEVRAKYYQEKYLPLNKVYDLDIDYISRELTKIDESEQSKTFYTLTHARA